MVKIKNRTQLNKGFTLAEVLIVVAIIGVLVGAAVPLFSSLSEKAKEATDLANIRTAYAEVMMEAVTDPSTEHSTSVTLIQQKDGWANGSTAEATLIQLGSVVGSPADPWECTLTWKVSEQKIEFKFSDEGSSESATLVYPSDERRTVMFTAAQKIAKSISELSESGRTSFASWNNASKLTYEWNGETFSSIMKSASIFQEDRNALFDGSKYVTHKDLLVSQGFDPDSFGDFANSSFFFNEDGTIAAVGYLDKDDSRKYYYVYEDGTTLMAPKSGLPAEVSYYAYFKEQAINDLTLVTGEPSH